MTKQEEALRVISHIVGPDGIVEGVSDSEPYLVDQHARYKGAAALIVRPKRTEEVSAIIKTCQEAGIGVVPQGGNTSYCGGATPATDGGQILLSLSRLNKVRETDPINFTMTAEAGVILANAQAEAEEHDMLFPLSMGSEGSCQIGGNLSTNAGGLAVLRYGTARDLVFGLEVVLPDGRVLHQLNGLRKDNTGYDLKALFLGAEGTLGVITCAVLKLFPQPKEQETAFLAVADPAAACRLLRKARECSGDAVTSFEYISRMSLQLVTQHIENIKDPLGTPYQHYVLMELSGPRPGTLRQSLETLLEDCLESGEILDGVVAGSGAQREQLWNLRENIPEAGKRAGIAIRHDISVMTSSIPEFISRAETRLKAIADHRLSVYGHIGDGNLHYNLLPPAGTDALDFRDTYGNSLSQSVYDLVAELGGSFSGEHGVGQLKRPLMTKYKSPVEIELMRALKAALDPKGIMNPGKLLP